jgi:hypothetical protein
LADLQKRLKRVPQFLRPLLKPYERVTINVSSEFLLLPDVVALAAIPYHASSMKNVAEGSQRSALKKRFGTLEDLRILASQRSTSAWTLFFDDSENGNGLLYAALGPKPKDVRVLAAPEEAYDSMVEHYLLGKEADFDFEPFVAPTEIL